MKGSLPGDVDKPCHETRETLEQQRRLFQIIIDNAHTQLVYLDREFNFVAVNAAYARSCNRSLEELIGANHFLLFPHDENEEIFRRARDTGETVYFHDKPFVFPDQPERGTTYWDWTLTPIRGGSGRVEGLVFSLVETTERRLAEEALMESHKRLLSILDANPDPVYVADAETYELLYINQALANALGEPVNTKCYEHLQGRGSPCPFCTNERILGENFGKVYIWEFQNENNRRWYRCLDRAITWPDGRVVRYEMATDITGRKKAEEAVLHAAERDHHIADVLQRALVPPQWPIQPAGYRIAARYRPALSEAEVCGDFYDAFDLGESKLGMVIGDVVGKGLPAAARVSAVTHTIRSYAFVDSRPANVVRLVSDAIFRGAETENDMLTAFYAVLDARADTIRYTNAGHEPPILLRADGSVELLDVGGSMLSGIGDQLYLEAGLCLGEGDVLAMVTDGITEARASDQAEHFGTDGVIRCLAECASASAEDIATEILTAALSYAGGDLRDDVAIVVVKRLSEG